jgi:hypothetical protein
LTIAKNDKFTVDAKYTNDDKPTWSGVQQTAEPTRAGESGLLVWDKTAEQYLRLPDATDPMPFPVVDSAVSAKQETANTALASILTKLADLATQTTLTAVLEKLQTGLGVTLNGSFPSLRGLSTDTKPTTGNTQYATFWEMDTGNMYYWSGTAWVVMN